MDYDHNGWKIDPTVQERDRFTILNGHGEGVAMTMFGWGTDEGKRIARLIASAPELLEACRELIEAGNYEETMAAMDKARAVVAKVEGRS